jgi:hypothetical protein
MWKSYPQGVLINGHMPACFVDIVEKLSTGNVDKSKDELSALIARFSC